MILNPWTLFNLFIDKLFRIDEIREYYRKEIEAGRMYVDEYNNIVPTTPGQCLSFYDHLNNNTGCSNLETNPTTGSFMLDESIDMAGVPYGQIPD